jgi:uncharacterized protein (TIGR03000 family)
MRNSLTVLALAGSVLLPGGEASAQRQGSGRNNATVRSAGYGNGVYFGQSGYGSSYSGFRGASPFGYGGGSSFGTVPFGYGNNRGYYSPSVYGSTPTYYTTTPSYSVVPAVYSPQVPVASVLTPQLVPSGYDMPAATQQYVALTIRVPTADTQVWISNTLMTPQGTERLFHSPVLESGKTFVYTLRARWTADGQAVEQTRQVEVWAGQNLAVDFRGAKPAIAPAPARSK